MSLELSVPKILEKLANINVELEDHKQLLGPYNLKLIRISLLALQYFTVNIDDIKHKHHIYYCTVTVDDERFDVPIHLEHLPKPPEDKKKQFLNALPSLFISSYEIVKQGDNDDLAIFASKMEGLCIDGRTRKAFDFAAVIESPPAFQIVMENCYKKIEEENGEPTYYGMFAKVCNNYWNMPYSKDAANTSLCQKDGRFDTASFPLLSEYIESLCDYELNKEYSIFLDKKLINKTAIHTFLLFGLFSAVKNKDLENASEIFNTLIIHLSKCNSQVYIHQLEQIITLANELDVLNKSEKNEISNFYNRALEFAVYTTNSVLNRWFPLYWSVPEIEFLKRIFSYNDINNFIANNNTAHTTKIKSSWYLISLVSQVSALNEEEAIDLAINLNKIDPCKNYYGIFEEADYNYENQSLQCRLKLCKLNFKNPYKTEILTERLAHLIQQNDNLEIAAESFKLYLIHTQNKTVENIPAQILIIPAWEPSFIYALKLDKFLTELSQLNLDKNKNAVLKILIKETLVNTILSLLGSSRDITKELTSFSHDCVNKREFILTLHDMLMGEPLLSSLQVKNLIKNLQLFALNAAGVNDCHEELITAIDILFSKLEAKVFKEFKNMEESVAQHIEVLRNKEKYFDKQGYTKEKYCISELIKSLVLHKSNCFTKKITSLQYFRTKSLEAIQKARPLLEVHRGLKKILVNLILCIVTGGVGFLLLIGINKVVNNHFFFNVKTDSIDKLNKFSNVINNNRVSL